MMLQLEVFVVRAKIDNTFDQTHDSRDTRPAEQQVKNTHTDLAKIELVNAQTAQPVV